MFKDYNDYELIYLHREKNEKAFKVLMEKYIPFIKKSIYEYNLKYQIEDCMQECLIVLMHCVNTYDMDSKCMFFTYFSVCVKRRIIKFIRLEIKYSALEYNDSLQYEYLEEDESNSFFKEKEVNFSTELDNLIYLEIFKEGISAREFAKKYNLDIKKVYNATYKVRKYLQDLYK